MSDLANAPDRMGPFEPGGQNDPPAAEPPLPTGPWGALARVLTSPSDAFAVIRARSPWLPPYLLLGLMAAAMIALTFILLGDVMREHIQASLEAAGGVGMGAAGGAGMPDAESLFMISAVMGVAFALVTPLITGLIMALALYVTGLIFDNKANFGQLFSLAGYAEMPAFLLSLLTAALLILMPDRAMQFDLTAAVLVPSLGPGALHSVLTLITPFSVWSWTLLALGLSQVGQVPLRRGWWQVVTVFIGVVMVRIVMGEAATGLLGNMNLPGM